MYDRNPGKNRFSFELLGVKLVLKGYEFEVDYYNYTSMWLNLLIYFDSHSSVRSQVCSIDDSYILMYKKS